MSLASPNPYSFGIPKNVIQQPNSVVYAGRIIMADIPEEFDRPIISISESDLVGAPTGQTRNFYLEPKVFNRVQLGTGTTHPQLRSGLKNNSRFLEQLIIEERESEDKKSKINVCTAVHAYPTPNYVSCNMELELKKTFDQPSSLLCNIHPETGEIDIYSLPVSLYMSIPTFLSEMGKLKEVTSSTTFSIGAYILTVAEILGTQVMFGVRKF